MSDEYLYFESESSTGAIAVNEKAKVMIDNILASNGVIYIFDTLLFLPRVDIEIIYLRCYFNGIASSSRELLLAMTQVFYLCISATSY